ncbi:TPA: hypothetical protein ACUM2Z_001949, partial [Haemophilus influenzae]
SLLSSVWSQVGPPHYRRRDNSLITSLFVSSLYDFTFFAFRLSSSYRQQAELDFLSIFPFY